MTHQSKKLVLGTIFGIVGYLVAYRLVPHEIIVVTLTILSLGVIAICVIFLAFIAERMGWL